MYKRVVSSCPQPLNSMALDRILIIDLENLVQIHGPVGAGQRKLRQNHACQQPTSRTPITNVFNKLN